MYLTLLQNSSSISGVNAGFVMAVLKFDNSNPRSCGEMLEVGLLVRSMSHKVVSR